MSKPNPVPIFHHYVPKFLLKNFSTKRKKQHYAKVFDKNTRRTYTPNINDIMGENHFNTVEIAGVQICVEDVTARFDDVTAPIVRSIIQNRSLAHLSGQDRETLLYFIALQINRGIAARNSNDDAMDQFRAKLMKSVGEETLPPEITEMQNEDQRKLFNITNLISSLHDIVAVLKTRDMMLLRAATAKRFILGDNPVTIHNSLPSDGLWSNLGLACEGIQIYMPISPDLVISLWCPTLLLGFVEALERCRAIDAKLQTVELLAASHLKPEIGMQRQALAEKTAKVEVTLNAARANAAIPMDDDNILHQNYLQVAHAERYLISETGDFHPAVEMLDADPRFVTGRRMRVS